MAINFPEDLSEYATSFSVDGKTKWEYDVDTGVLRVAEGFIESSILEVLMKQVESMPGGVNVSIPVPLSDPARLKGVKRIEYLT